MKKDGRRLGPQRRLLQEIDDVAMIAPNNHATEAGRRAGGGGVGGVPAARLRGTRGVAAAAVGA